MKFKSILILSLSLLVVSISCAKDELAIDPSANVTTEERSVSDFNKIDIEGPFAVFITIGTTESVEVEANENLQQYIKTYKAGDKLVVDFEDDTSISGNKTLKVYVTLTNLIEIEGEGATVIHLQSVLTETNFKLDLSGASVFNGEINVETFDADLEGASVMNLDGHADDLELDASGASVIADFDFDVDNLDADLSGASVLTMTVNTQIDLVASGASFFYWKGSAVVNSINLSGASKIINEN